MAKKPTAKPKKPPLTDSERHKRFSEVANEIGATGPATDFDGVLKRVAAQKKTP